MFVDCVKQGAASGLFQVPRFRFTPFPIYAMNKPQGKICYHYKRQLRGLAENSEVKKFIGCKVHIVQITFSTNGIQALQHRWKKCVDCFGGYVEKKLQLPILTLYIYIYIYIHIYIYIYIYNYMDDKTSFNK